VFARDPGTGFLTPVKGRGGCARIYWADTNCFSMHLNKPTAMAVSPDGKELFITGYCCADTFEVLRRDTRTGALLARVACCTDGIRAVTTAEDVAVSPDGRSLYIASDYDAGHGLAVLMRNPKTGSLTQPAGAAGCIQRIGADGCAAAPSTSFAPERVVVAADGAWVYVLSNGGLFTFARDATTGTLSPGPCFTPTTLPPCTQLPVSAEDLVASADGRNVYIVGTYRMQGDLLENAIVVFQRQTPTSQLAPISGPDGCVAGSSVAGTTCRMVPALVDDFGADYGPDRDLAISANDRTVYAWISPETGRTRVLALARDVSADGALRPTGPPMPIRGPIADATAMLPTRNGRQIYITEDRAVVVYRNR
jgi:DNA-binding beta-propeller fold protein YncE